MMFIVYDIFLAQGMSVSNHQHGVPYQYYTVSIPHYFDTDPVFPLLTWWHLPISTGHNVI